ncbi:helicase-related protein [Brevibacillus laterosporus]|uniref:DEAD/DEAH box helicase n=1 Tax=Brevibacillus laterosporus TaxID=1465 RepID=UPI00215D0AAB|nr:helicase-related protein [Brevibacillus laterosporus]MCR8939456.1 helicase-related protein [Brevibacillus laterosporus]MCZ0842096.1 helicase-related protein [Brevibacillus laterosporus]MCZ0843808.1 helicase-related protein [Brevibacillus laterosporus]
MHEYVLYIKEDGQSVLAYITPCFQIDKQFWKEQNGQRLHIIGKSKSLALLFAIRDRVNQKITRQVADGRVVPHTLKQARLLAQGYTKEVNRLSVKEVGENYSYGRSYAFSFEEIEDEGKTCEPNMPETQKVLEFLARNKQQTRQLLFKLQGRALLLDEVKRLSLQESPYVNQNNPDYLIMSLQWLILQGKAEWRPSISLELNRSWWEHQLSYHCERCNSVTEIERTICYSCQQPCSYCYNCLSMGRCKSCVPLICVPADLLSQSDPTVQRRTTSATVLQWNGQFSKRQAIVAKKVREFVFSKERRFLIWAVCGAGKTELVFPAVDAELTRGGTVCIATPRKDVVLELAPRLQKVFPSISVVAIHGSSQQKWEQSQLIISTTHQMLRCYQRFSLIVIDEVDAFPYHKNETLYHAVKRSLVPHGKILYLSATPPHYLQKELVTKRVDNQLFPYHKRLSLTSSTHAILPARFHGHPLPIPTKLIKGHLNRSIHLLQPITSLLFFLRNSLQAQRQVFIFVSRIEEIPFVLAYVQHFFPDMRDKVEGVHASDPAREHKVRAFRERVYRIIVTTTILERGVTIPRSDCIVLEADAAIFDEASLVQIAGRVGRSSDYPEGQILYLMNKKSTGPTQAIRHIKRMNRLAEETATMVE